MENLQQVNLKIEGMSCTNCALSVEKLLKKSGAEQVHVNFISGEAQFETDSQQIPTIVQGIKQLGYQVKQPHNNRSENSFWHNFNLGSQLTKFIFSAIFTLPLLVHMLPGIHIHALMNPYVQLVLSSPVYVLGMLYFGRSALKSVQHGMPNMNVLVTIGASASYWYSVYGLTTNQPATFLFFETAASVITFMFFGNFLEDKAVQQTTKSLQKLAVHQQVKANMISFDEHHQELIFEVDNSLLRVGDLVLIKTGEQVPADCKILWGEVQMNEALISGESKPIPKQTKDNLIGGSTVVAGTAKAQITAVGEHTVLSQIVEMVKKAMTDKPPVQLLADKISAWFVPVILMISLATGLYHFFATHELSIAILRAVAVLVVACPCAMGLATPAAVAVGLGRAASYGILFKQASCIEKFKDIKQIVFDKTGTLTTGQFTIQQYYTSIDASTFKDMVVSMEKYSNHPLAKAILAEWKVDATFRWQKIEEIKGRGLIAVDKLGDSYEIVSHRHLPNHIKSEGIHSMYVLKNGELVGWIDVEDTIRAEVPQLITRLKAMGIKPILLSGDNEEKCQRVAKQIGIEDVYANHSPEEKLHQIEKLNAVNATAMVGDGINDGPALALASIGITISGSSQLAIQSADVVLMEQGLTHLITAIQLGKKTYATIKSNFAWAFIYNVLAIPVAAAGYLHPTFGALVMSLSDVVLAVNSVSLRWQKIEQ